MLPNLGALRLGREDATSERVYENGLALYNDNHDHFSLTRVESQESDCMAMFVLMAFDDVEMVLEVSVHQSNESLAQKQQEVAAWMAANFMSTREQAELEVFKRTTLTTVFSVKAAGVTTESTTPHTRKSIWLGGASNYSNAPYSEQIFQAGGYDRLSNSFKRLTVVQDGPFRLSTPPNRCVPDLLTAINAAVQAIRTNYPVIQSIPFTGQFAITDIGTMSLPEEFDRLKAMSHCVLNRRLRPFFNRYNDYKQVGFEFPALTDLAIQHWHARSAMSMFLFLQNDDPAYPQRDDGTPDLDWWKRFINTDQIIYPGRQIKDINLSFRGDLVAISQKKRKVNVLEFQRDGKRGRTGASLDRAFDSTGVEYLNFLELRNDDKRLIMRVPSSDGACQSSYYVVYEYDVWATKHTVSVCQAYETDAQLEALVPVQLQRADVESVFGFHWDNSNESGRGAFKALEVSAEHVWTKTTCRRTIRHAIRAAARFMRIYFPCVDSISYTDQWAPNLLYQGKTVETPLRDMRALASMTTLEEMTKEVDRIFFGKYHYYQELGFEFFGLDDTRVREWEAHVAQRLLDELTPEMIASVEQGGPTAQQKWFKNYVNTEEYRKPDLQRYGFVGTNINTWFNGELLSMVREYDLQDALAAAQAAAQV